MTQQKHRVYALIDCNNFFASCEKVFRPDLATRPVAVLSNNDGCIIARSAELKAIGGVPMGVPLFKVRSHLAAHNTAIFSANFGLYGDMSQRITRIIEEAAPRIEVYSIDESFVDITDLTEQDYGRWAARLARTIYAQTGVPVSIGVAPSKTLAKAAADHAKKHREDDSVYVALNDAVIEGMLQAMPVGDVWGIGRRYSAKLIEQGVSTAWALTQLSDTRVQNQLTIRGLMTVRELRGESLIDFDVADGTRKMIGRSRSFGHNVRDYHQLESAVATFMAHAAGKCRQQGSVTGSVAVYLRTPKHSDRPGRNVGTTIRLHEPTADTGSLITAALEGLESIYDPDFAYQKAGIVLLELRPRTAWQLALMDGVVDRERKVQLMRAVDSLKKKFGSDSVWHATENRSSARWTSKSNQRSPAYTTSWADIPSISLM